MAYTLEQLTKLEAAIASGALKVKYADKEVTYQSTTEMLKVRGIMRDELGLNKVASRRALPSFSKGTQS